MWLALAAGPFPRQRNLVSSCPSGLVQSKPYLRLPVPFHPPILHLVQQSYYSIRI